MLYTRQSTQPRSFKYFLKTPKTEFSTRIKITTSTTSVFSFPRYIVLSDCLLQYILVAPSVPPCENAVSALLQKYLARAHLVQSRIVSGPPHPKVRRKCSWFKQKWRYRHVDRRILKKILYLKWVIKDWEDRNVKIFLRLWSSINFRFSFPRHSIQGYDSLNYVVWA